MKPLARVILNCALELSVTAGAATGAEEKPVELVPVLKIDKELDRRTVIKPSKIPGAGDGLFAAVAIKKDQVIGELGGQLRTEDDYPEGNYYRVHRRVRLGGSPSVSLPRRQTLRGPT